MHAATAAALKTTTAAAATELQCFTTVKCNIQINI